MVGAVRRRAFPARVAAVCRSVRELSEILRDEVAVDQLDVGLGQALGGRAGMPPAPIFEPLMLRTGQMQRLVDVRNTSSAL